jgi:hypothetical protein
MKAPLALLFLGLVACTDQKAEAPAGEASADEAPDPSVFDPLTGTLDRAAGVEDTLREGEAARRRAIEEAEGR